tara:strand:+ start:1281 stop:2918 length:1638 start_codon:yes stop_codon:yes gene_type:complete
MSGIYQLNQATGSTTLPSSGNTFIGTSTNSELYSVDSSGAVTVYGTGSGGGGGGTIDTGSFATTGSNTFVGDQIINGNLAVSQSKSIFAQDFRNPYGSTITFGDGVTIDGISTVTQNAIFQGSYISGSDITNISIGGNITSSGNISASGDVIANIFKVEDKNFSIYHPGTNAIRVGHNVTNTVGLHLFGHVTASGNISASGDLSIIGFPSVSASLASAGGGGFTPSLSTDLPARNITASANISASGDILTNGGFYSGINTRFIENSSGQCQISDATGGQMTSIQLKAIDTNMYGMTANSVNVDTTDTSSSFDIGTGEQIIPVWSTLNVSSSGIISQAFPSGRIGRTTEIIGDAIFNLGPASYNIDGHHVMYHSGSRELWRATGEWDLSPFGMPRSVGHLLKYGDGNTAGNAFTFNDYELVVGENMSDVWGGAFLLGRQSGSTYGANTQYAGFFVSASLGLPGTPQGHDKAFTIYTGQQTGKAFNIYNAQDPDSLSGIEPVFSVSSSGATTIKGLPTAEPSTTGSLWISGSSVAHPNSGYLMVFNP